MKFSLAIFVETQQMLQEIRGSIKLDHSSPEGQHPSPLLNSPWDAGHPSLPPQCLCEPIHGSHLDTRLGVSGRFLR